MSSHKKKKCYMYVCGCREYCGRLAIELEFIRMRLTQSVVDT
jgi:hypothetical protein